MSAANGPVRAGRYLRWSTYETAVVVEGLHASDDFDHWCRVAEAMVRDTPWVVLTPDEGVKPEWAAVDRIAEELQDHFHKMIPRLHSTYLEKLLQAALWRVNWKEIANHLAKPCVNEYPAELTDSLRPELPTWQERAARLIRTVRKCLQTRHT
jgi:hypothetical protein